MKKGHARIFVPFVLLFAWLTGSAAWVSAQEENLGQTPPRLSLAEGQVSFWRPGAEEWTKAQVNTPLSPGDQLHAGSPGNLELQIGSGAFIRAWEQTQIGFETHEPDFLVFKVTTGFATIDLRSLAPGHTLEVDTPNAAFTIEHVGYYRVKINGDRTTFITRRAGEATVTPAGGQAHRIAAGEQVVVDGVDTPHVSSNVAPPLDNWDQWNYDRTDQLLSAASARYVAPDVYGADELDSAGTWRVVPTYGAVWAPSGVPAGWAPYSTGSWIRDPYYGWTWVDTAPWGWAPYHYGRWIHVDRVWCWAPGPLVARPPYAPALVAFLGAHRAVVAWVALGWGEPLVPWWGPPAFRHRPWWGGWHGPRFVNDRGIHRNTRVRVESITVYRNTRVRHAVVGLPERYFGRGRMTRERLANVDVHDLRPDFEAPGLGPIPVSFAPLTDRGFRPSEEILRRTVVSTRPPRVATDPSAADSRNQHPSGQPETVLRSVGLPPHEPERRPPVRPRPAERSNPDLPGHPEPRNLPPPQTPERPDVTSRPRPPAPPPAETSGSRPRDPVVERSVPRSHRPGQSPMPETRVPETREGSADRHGARERREHPSAPENRLSPRDGLPDPFRQPTDREVPQVDGRQNSRRSGQPGQSESEPRIESGRHR